MSKYVTFISVCKCGIKHELNLDLEADDKTYFSFPEMTFCKKCGERLNWRQVT